MENIYYKNKFKRINLLQAQAVHQNSKYEKIKIYFAKKKTSKEETVILDDTSDSNSSSSSEAEKSLYEDEKTSFAYDSESADN